MFRLAHHPALRTRPVRGPSRRAFLLLCMGIATPTLADEGSTTPFLRDSRFTLQLRSHFLERDTSTATDSVSWAGGGWLTYRSGWAFDSFRVGLTAYTSQKLYGPEDKDGASLLATGQQSYTVLGESFIEGRYAGQQLQAGRFLVNQHEGNPQDTRMSPRTFQGVALSGQYQRFEFYAARLTHMKTRNATEFAGIATVAGAPAGVSAPMWFLSGHYLPDAQTDFGFSSYLLPDVLASTYFDFSRSLPLATEAQWRLGAQYMWQGSNGTNRLTGSPFDTHSAGIRVEWRSGSWTLSALAMQTASSAAYRTPFGSWQGYACRIITSFNRAGERAQGFDAALDLAQWGVPGMTVNGSATFGRHALDAASGAPLPDNREYDLTVEYRFATPSWPRWLQPLALRARTAELAQQLAASRTQTREHHLIANYRMELE